MTSSAYVFIHGLEKSPIICGKFQYAGKTKGEFRYGKSYLARPDAFALDPINLPLTEQVFTTTANQNIFGVLTDAGPDSWGKKLILSLHTTKPQNDLEYLVAGAGMGVGALMFSLSQSSSKPKENKNTLGDLDNLLDLKDKILNNQAINDEAKTAFEYGSSMGGARPKTLIIDNQTAYLAKFNRSDDLFNTARAEHAAMSLLRQLGATVAPTKVINSPNGDVLLIERFDIKSHQPSHHFISANALFNRASVSPLSASAHYSYGRLAEIIMKHCHNPHDAHQLYLRMVFNVFIGNTDDHARNHALIYSFADKHWLLSPAYDVLPISNNRQHGIAIGEYQRDGTIENLLSQSKRFGLKQFKAQKIINQVRDACEQWPQYFSQNDVSNIDIERLKGVIPAIKN